MAHWSILYMGRWDSSVRWLLIKVPYLCKLRNPYRWVHLESIGPRGIFCLHKKWGLLRNHIRQVSRRPYVTSTNVPSGLEKKHEPTCAVTEISTDITFNTYLSVDYTIRSQIVPKILLEKMFMSSTCPGVQISFFLSHNCSLYSIKSVSVWWTLLEKLHYAMLFENIELA